MAKLKHTFVRGRMNKDIDERLMPNGEYRDALNIQVATSEGSNVGAIENVLGNTKKNIKVLPNTEWDSGFGLTNPVCIGGTRDAQNDKIYWFVTSESVDAILEYSKSTGLVAPILVDTQNVLRLDPNYLITGINIIDGLLFWTDGLNEPKSININRFKTGSSQGISTSLTTHTQVYGRDFVLSDVTVITKAPGQRLIANADASLVGGPGTGITPILTNSSNLLAGVEAGDQVIINWSASGSAITWPANSSVTLNAEIKQPNGNITKYQVVGTFTTGLTNVLAGTIEVSSATPYIPDVNLVWEMLLIEKDPIFKDDFPRFSYRYKYTDGRYSTYAPFSTPVFIPGEFEYLSRDGNNEGMQSVIRKISLSNFPVIPDDVTSIEVLYKGSRSTNVYLIETIEHDYTVQPPAILDFEITSSVLGPVIEETQLLRLYDNVPIKAKAQEIIANRIVYGNYTQNYNIGRENTVSIDADFSRVTHPSVGFGQASVKTNREYQIGVSFLDQFGRETPVFTANSGAISFSGSDSAYINKIVPTLASNTQALVQNGGFATHFKYYIKDSSAEYYNIALDRYYNSKDGGVWLSFPSSERNKLIEGKYITLKKEHDSNVAVTVNNKYKVLDISNNAPEYLTWQRTIKARSLCYNIPSQVDFQVGNNVIRFLGPELGANDDFHSAFSTKFNTNIYIKFETTTGAATTAEYRVKSAEKVGEITVGSTPLPVFEVQLAEGLKVEDSWIADFVGQNTFNTFVYEETSIQSPEFQGRFFVKIDPNATFYNSLTAAFAQNVVPLVEDKTLEIDPDGSAIPPAANSFYTYWDGFVSTPAANPELPWEVGIANPGAVGDKTTFVLGVSDYHWTSGNIEENLKYQAFEKLDVGTYFKFKYIDGSVSNDYYRIISVNWIGGGSQSTGVDENYYHYFMDREFDDTQYNGTPTAAQLDKIVIYRQQEQEDGGLLSSQNPAIFETEPDELADLDIYWEASGFIPASQAGQQGIALDWFNCYSFGNGVESDRVRDDYNAPTLGKGVRVSTVLKEPYATENRTAGLIYSGIYNNISGVNELNQFIAGLKITKDLDPVYGGIQKLFSRDTNLLAFCEDKVYGILADKDALFNADGNVNLTSTNRVLGNASTFAGEFGISKNPESFAQYGFRVYFTDKARGAVLRLSNDGITEISEKGMADFFVDAFAVNSTPVIGSFDESTSAYNIKLNNESVSYKERVDGWPTRLSFDPEFAVSLNNEYYTFKNGEIWEHSNETRNNFYGSQESSQVTAVFNDVPSAIKNFKAISYEGTERWTADIVTDKQSGSVDNWRENEGIYYNFIKGEDLSLAVVNGKLNSKDFSVQGIGTITAEIPGAPYTIEVGGNVNTSLSIGDTLYIKRANNIFEVGDVVATVANRVAFNDVNAIAPITGEYAFFLKSNQINTSGILGYYANITFTNSDTNFAELFAINSEVFISSE